MMPTVKHPDGFPCCISLSILFNDHANYYMTVEKWIESEESFGRTIDWISDEERARAIETDSVWTCQWYPTTPIGSYSLSASSFETLMKAVNKALDR